MLPGPDYIYECPACGHLTARGSLISGNTLMTKVFSDGKIIFEMLPEFPKITKCSKCNHIFWISKLDKIGQRERDNHGEWADVESCKFLSIYDYIAALDTKLYTSKDEELFICLRILWGYNDRVRKGQHIFSFDFDIHHWEKNIYRLLYLIDDNQANKLLIAELHRNLGNFNKCIEIIYSIKDDNKDWEKSKFIEHCKSQDKLVFELDYYLKSINELKNTKDKPFSEKKKRIGELQIIEGDLKKQRDFTGLIPVFNEIMSLIDSHGVHSKLILQKAYCYARLGKIEEAKETLSSLNKISFFIDETNFIIQNMVVSFFFDVKVNDLNTFHINTIKKWIQDPDTSIQVKQTIFDYEDFIKLES